ncbi:MAG: competence protein CoiA family protein [Undibacterium sp.]|nr:competence protein CoiA family protein [Undibacterium sp.]
MPLRAMIGDTNIFSYDYDSAQWAELKTSYKTKNLVMPCCGQEAIPKRSPLGTFFFAHMKKDECSTAPESSEHIYIKMLIAKAATIAGWTVTTEWPGVTPNGEKWIADVFCKRGKALVALEVQMSYQSPTDMHLRQKRYEQSGIRCSWFLSSKKFNSNYSKATKKTPFFILSPVLIGSEPKIDKFSIELTDFIKGMLNGKLSWKEELSEYRIHYIQDICHKCHLPVKQVHGYSIDVYGDGAKTIPNASNILERMLSFISNEELKQLGLNTIGRFDKMNGKLIHYPYCNACIHCGTPQNNFYLLKNLEDAQSTSNRKKLGSAKFLKNEGCGEWHFNSVSTSI